jgi:hypothetical protein
MERIVRQRADRAAYQAELHKAETAARKRWAEKEAKKKAESRYAPRPSIFSPRPAPPAQTRVRYVTKRKTKKSRKKPRKKRVVRTQRRTQKRVDVLSWSI